VIGWGSTTDRILLLLNEHEMTKLELCGALGLNHDQVSSVLTRLKRPSKEFGKRIYICAYTRQARGARYYLRPVFKAGDSKDCNRPSPISQKKRSAKSHAKKMLIKRSQIFGAVHESKQTTVSDRPSV
jgi:hypothetical protein